ncbi:MAG: PHP-associated domain-containing protein [archaeon]
MKVDLHVHTNYSKCSNLELKELKKLCDKFKIKPAITDHNTIEGAKKFKDCIVGEEINTKEGELIGLFLNERIKPGLEIDETVEKIREQGGFVYVPHPYDWVRRNHIKRLDFDIDIVEVFNGRVMQQKNNRKARAFAKKNNFLMGIGSDTHTIIEFGHSYVVMDDFDSPKDFLKKLEKAKFVTKQVPLYVRGFNMLNGFFNKHF